MWLYYISIALAVVANVFYHIIQKSTPSSVNPIASLVVTYFTAAFTCLLILPFYPGRETLIASFRKLNWTSFSLGIAIVGLELGFFIAYRVGWNISTAGVVANVIVALILIPVGLMVFREHLSLTNVSGVVLCIIGLFLITKK